ncbi:hypothetical protein EGR_10701 [Echinococcus granulosus]|uniref:Uncharacterized protein n=1 Tax=Echinococcus granulosus TaxID=6210 RepID=W6U0C0_ECHGR|nr:hypothetical protein EGR_10701 [Echinococcus granulosus]EUB54438.1 hypothetical protein EGR_10701 [Echinococcus granulosus]
MLIYGKLTPAEYEHEESWFPSTTEMTIHTADHIAAPLRTVKHRASPIAVPAQMATNTSFHTGAPPQTAPKLSTQFVKMPSTPLELEELADIVQAFLL